MSSRRLRIVHVITEGHLMGGAQLNTFHSLRYQQKYHNVHLVVGNGGPLADRCRAHGIPVRIIPMRNRLVDPVSDAVALLRLTRYLRRVSPHVVHTHSSKAGILGRVAGRLASTPIVVHTLHGPSFSERQSQMTRYVVKRIEYLCALLSDKLIAVADTLADVYVQSRICGHDKVCTVVSGIDFSRFPDSPPDARHRVRAALGVPDTTRLITNVAHFMPEKGQELLVEAVARLNWREHKARVLLVGAGAQLDRVRARVHALSLAEAVIFTGARDDVPDLLAASDVFVQTSGREGLSRSLIEAMYAGIPVVASDVGATREVVIDGESGFLYPPGNVDALRAHLEVILGNPALGVEMGARGRLTVAASRTVDVMGEGLERLYADLLERKRPARAATPVAESG